MAAWKNNWLAGLLLAAWLIGVGGAWMSAPQAAQAAPAPARAKPTRTPSGGSGNAPSPSAVIAAVNAVRSANGLAPFQTNAALMAAAQAHSNYQASIGSATHSGAGGSDVKSRALAAGYGGGADVSVIENIYSGMNASPQQAVSWWQGDSLHLGTLLATRQTEVGAGVAVSGGVVYYTLDVGVVVGGSAPAVSTGSPAAAGTGGAAATSSVAYNPVEVSTPNPDGSIIHVVKEGQTLWTIAAIYKMDINELLTINGMYPTSLIRPGQKITIRPAGQQPTDTPEGTPTEVPTRTPRPTRTPTAPVTAAAVLAATQGVDLGGAGLGGAVAAGKRGPNLLLIGIGVLVVGGAVLLLAGNLLKRVE